jgi:inner membrane protein
MDSLTQIVLGAAVGELVLGKKIGNRAMVWGAVGGTIPDLDVLGKFFLTNIDNLAFHRGFSHSILFSLLGAWMFGKLVYLIYKSPHHKWIALMLRFLATILIGFSIHFVLTIIAPKPLIPMLFAGAILAYILYRTTYKKYFTGLWESPKASEKEWQWLFFWSLLTHPILDCFTMYGTQLFSPFTNTRVAWSTISVADPLYTMPFIVCLLIAATYKKEANLRRKWNQLGILVSSLYLGATVINKINIDAVYREALSAQEIEVKRFVTNPAILSNVLWSCVAETDTSFYLSQYSLFDQSEIVFTEVAKNHNLLKNKKNDETLKTLAWFSDNYYNVIPQENSLQINDLRFGVFFNEENTIDAYIFRFELLEGKNGYEMQQAEGGPPKEKQAGMFSALWKRIKGV